MGAKDGVTRSNVEDMCASLLRYVRSFVENFRAGLKKSINEAFRAGVIGSQFHDDGTIEALHLVFRKTLRRTTVRVRRRARNLSILGLSPCSSSKS